MRPSVFATLVPAASLLPLPALAGDADLTAIAADLALKAEDGGYAAAIAACILGNGDVKTTEKLFTTGGWAATRDDDTTSAVRVEFK